MTILFFIVRYYNFFPGKIDGRVDFKVQEGPGANDTRTLGVPLFIDVFDNYTGKGAHNETGDIKNSILSTDEIHPTVSVAIIGTDIGRKILIALVTNE